MKSVIVRNILILQFFSLSVALPPAEATINYPSKGTASYYTARSCKREGTSGIWTASGERYNENALTCATRDKSLFGKYIKVTNLDNGKSILVRVNDFGPNKRLFLKGRIIDLSKRAFSKLDNLKKGVIKVNIEVQ